MSSRAATTGVVRRYLVLAGICAVSLALMLSKASPALAAGTAWWHTSTSARPTNLPPGGTGTIVVEAENIGDEATSGPATVTESLPAGLTAQSVSFFSYSFGEFDLGPEGPLGELNLCSVAASQVSCTGGELIEKLNPYEYLELQIHVSVGAEAASGSATTVVTGGGAPRSQTHQELTVDGSPNTFGVEQYELIPEAPGGAPDVRAGSHPFQLTATLNVNQNSDLTKPPGLARNLQFKLPPGLLGNTRALPQCSDLAFRQVLTGGIANACPPDTAVGAALVVVDEPVHIFLHTFPIPLFNLVPGKGEPARFGFEVAGLPVILDTEVRTGDDYGVTVKVSNVTELANFISSTVTFWGVPGEAAHDESRGWGCLVGRAWAAEPELPCTPAGESKPAPFLTMPTSCESPFTTTVTGSAWPTKGSPEGLALQPREYSLQDEFGRALGIVGCNQLSFKPEIEVKPDGPAASTPTGLTTRIRVPQEVSENAGGLASSSVRDIAVSLPEGVTINPAGAGGLEACSEGLVGYLPGASNPATNELHFTPKLPEPLEPGLNFCSNASKVGTVKIKVPLIKNPLEGSVYLATQNANPFGSLVAMYIVAEDPESGVLVKLPGEVALSEGGNISATFKNSPQAPFEEAEVHFFGGSRAPLATPAHCGSYTTNALLTPWSGSAPVAAQSSFDITSGPNGGPCPGTLPFAPALAGGTTNIQAGAFSPLTTTISREDGNQDIQTVQLHMPPGLSGILAGVPLCGEAQANAGTCGQGSLIGHTTVSVGLGNEPFSVVGGEVFLTEKIAGSPADAPFGLSIVNPAVAGPFNLGKVVVRATIAVDPHTAALTVTTGVIPHILDGIPLQIKHVNVTIEGAGGDLNRFTFNPTNCSKTAITGSIGSVEGASAPVAVPFQVTNCASLKFAPKFTVSTAGKNSKANGATLTAKLSYPNAPQGTQANITRVKVDLPKQLPSRLTTLQKACTSKQFELNPANCPKESKIGFAKVTTPLLPVPLEGPAIFVSHGGEAFPSLTMVLQGAPPYNVTVDLVGTTFISSKGITSTTFKTVPDVPFNTFTLTLPQGKFSALAANVPAKNHYSLCGQTLAMPTEFVGQNGAKINRSTKIAVSGCAKKKVAKKKAARKPKKRGKR